MNYVVALLLLVPYVLQTIEKIVRIRADKDLKILEVVFDKKRNAYLNFLVAVEDYRCSQRLDFHALQKAALDWQSRGREFDPLHLHHIEPLMAKATRFLFHRLCNLHLHRRNFGLFQPQFLQLLRHLQYSQSFIQNIDSSIYISIMAGMATRTIPFSNT